MARTFTFWRTTLLLVALLLLGACSTTTFFYNRLDFLLPWYLDDYVELEGTQEQFLDELLEPFLAEHRSEELPRYVELLAQIEQTIDKTADNPVTPGDMELIWHNTERAFLRLEQDALAWLLVLGEELTEEQIQEFLDNLDEQQQEYREEYLERDDEEYAEDTYDYMEDTVQEYLGRLDREQKKILVAAAEQMQRSDQAWLDERLVWLGKLRVTLQRKPGWQQEILTAIEKREENMPAGYLEVIEHNSQVLYALFAEVLNSRTEKQDKHLRKKLRELKEDLNTLIAQAERPDGEAEGQSIEEPCSPTGC